MAYQQDPPNASSRTTSPYVAEGQVFWDSQPPQSVNQPQAYAYQGEEPPYVYHSGSVLPASYGPVGQEQGFDTFANRINHFDQATTPSHQQLDNQQEHPAYQCGMTDHYQRGVNNTGFSECGVKDVSSEFVPIQREDFEELWPMDTQQTTFPPLVSSTNEQDSNDVLSSWQSPPFDADVSMDLQNLDDVGFSTVQTDVQVSNWSRYKNSSAHAYLDGNESVISINLIGGENEYQALPQETHLSASRHLGPGAGSDQPWTPLAASRDHGHRAGRYNMMQQLSDRIQVPATIHSTNTSQSLGSSYGVVRSMSSMTSFSQVTQENIVDSTDTLRQRDLRLATPGTGLGFTNLGQTPPRLIQQGIDAIQVVPGLANLDLLHSTTSDSRLLSPSRSRRSDATSTSSRVSASNPMLCEEPDCLSQFTGPYRRGNYARHKRDKHNGPVVIMCESLGCNRVFKRKDARLKHYRKHHPELASDPVPRPERTKAGRPAPSDQEFTLSRVGSGLTGVDGQGELFVLEDEMLYKSMIIPGELEE